MKRLAFLLLLPLTAWAQYSGPAVDACRAYGERELKKHSTDVKALVFDRDRHPVIEKYARKLGNQFVSSILSGNGARESDVWRGCMADLTRRRHLDLQ